MITSARIREDLYPLRTASEWISALRATPDSEAGPRRPVADVAFRQDGSGRDRSSRFSRRGDSSPASIRWRWPKSVPAKRPGSAGRHRKQLEKHCRRHPSACQTKPLHGKQNIGLRAGKVLNRYKMGKHFQLRIEEDSFFTTSERRPTSSASKASTASMSFAPASRRRTYPAVTR